MTKYLHQFGSLDELIAFCDAPKNPAYGPDHSTGDRNPEWSGTATYGEARDLAVNGWTEIRPRVEELAEPLRERLKGRFDTAPDRMYDVCGSLVDIAQFMSGEPECMVSFMPQPERNGGKVIRIGVNVGANATIDADKITARGVAVLALAESIAMVGGTAEIVTVDGAARQGHEHHVTTVIHAAGSAIDADRIMFALGNPAFLRRLMFAVGERVSTDQIRAMGWDSRSHGIGGSCSGKIDGVDLMIRHQTSNDDPMVTDPAAWVIDQMTALGFDIID